MKILKKWFNYFENKNKIQKEGFLKSEFTVTEKGGKLWLLHQGVAFMGLSEDSSAREIANILNETRETAVKYSELWKNNSLTQ